jgi:hypothetical protein
VPFCSINFAEAGERAEHDALVGLVERILAAKKRDPGADTTEWEREIDRLVYKLYALTPEEIILVEESTRAK